MIPNYGQHGAEQFILWKAQAFFCRQNHSKVQEDKPLKFQVLACIGGSVAELHQKKDWCLHLTLDKLFQPYS